MEGSKVFQAIRVREASGTDYLPRSGDEEFQEVESALEFRLPKSYRTFCAQFGPGELGGHYRISAPIGLDDDYNLENFHRDWVESPFGPNWPEDERVGLTQGRTIFFAATVGGEAFAWHLDELQDSGANEYLIYHLPRMEKPVPIASSFDGFILKFCLSEKDKWRPDPVFTRFEPS